jgi:2-polyprenyl-3-methyl-5-hydroxy-6-metoxy-1,4-benzoquinol methylase
MASTASNSNPSEEKGSRTQSRLVRAYAFKPQGYFAGARADYVAALPVNPNARILEIGCGEGRTGELALTQQKCGTFCGVELTDTAAERARQVISEVVVGSVEQIGLPWPRDFFDVLILSEVLEHLVDPWIVLKRLRTLLKPGATIFASSPNVSNYQVVRMLIQGEWTLTDMGIMDKTHLRWFTPRSYRELFEGCGYVVDYVGSVEMPSRKAKIASWLTFGLLRHLFISQVDLRAHRP